MPEKKSQILALFDFDGTITKRDTLFLFLRFYKGSFIFIINIIRLLPVFLLYKLKIISNRKAKEVVLTLFLGNEPFQRFEEKCKVFTEQVLPKAIRDSAKVCIESYQDKQARIVVVTASPEYWVRPWCKDMGIECIGTQLEVQEGKLTGKIKGKNCYGEEKVVRIKNTVHIKDYPIIVAFGDSKGDFPMLRLADEPHYRPFRDS